MSGYRQLHTHIWSDSWFVELKPDMKLLFIYLFSNERASICGLYELPLRTISFETGLDREVIRKGLEVFNIADKAKYDFEDGVVWVKNMLKYQGSTSPKVQARIQADIKAVPECTLKQQLLDTLSIPYGRGIDTSSLISSIDQFKREEMKPELTSTGGQGEAPAAQAPPPLPDSPFEAALHPDLQVFSAVTGGRLPGEAQYRAVIEAVRFLRTREKLEDPALQTWLMPYWLAWSSRKRLDGRPYDPRNLTWLVEWALNRSIPPGGDKRAPSPAGVRVPTAQETRRMLDEKDEQIKAAVPPPEEVLAKIRGVLGRMKGRETHEDAKMDQAGSPGGAAHPPDRGPGPPP